MVIINQCLLNKIERALLLHKHSEVLPKRKTRGTITQACFSEWLFPIGGKTLSGSMSDGPIPGIRFNYRSSLAGVVPPAPPLWPWCQECGCRKGEPTGQLQMGCTTCTLIVPIKVWMLVNRVMTWNKSCKNGSCNKRVSSLPLYSPLLLCYHNTITSSLFHDRLSKGKSSKCVKEHIFTSLIFIAHCMPLKKRMPFWPAILG